MDRTASPASLKSLWSLDPAVTFLNHGSFGACPRVVLDAQQRHRAEMEREPVRFFTRIAPPLFDAARQALARLLGADERDLVFVTNATAGVNAVLRSLRWQTGDELLVTDHAYNACRNVVDYVAKREGVAVNVCHLKFPVASADECIDAIVGAATPLTRLAMIDHVTSATGLVLPIEAITRQLQSRGIDVLVDGAHAPGQVELNLDQLNAAYYTGNCHKWLCAPKGAGFLHVREDRQAGIVPPVISHGFNSARAGRSRLHDLFDWTGTLDVSPMLCVEDAIEFVSTLLPAGGHGGAAPGLSALMAHNRQLALTGRRILCEALQVAPPVPEEMVGSLAAGELPADPHPQPQLDFTTSPTPQHMLQSRLMREHQIEVPAFYFPKHPRRLLRISAQVYNETSEYEKLAAALVGLLAELA